MTDKRQHIRTAFPAPVKVMHPQWGSMEVKMRDISNGGLFLLTGDRVNLPVGEQVSVQALDMEDAPVLRARIVRIEAEGIALMFDED